MDFGRSAGAGVAQAGPANRVHGVFMPQHNSTWIVVADIDRARILYLERPGAPVRRVFEESAAALRRFAVADVVNEMAANHGFDRLVLVAAPRTLGELRETLSEEARACIAAECEQDLSRFSDDMVVHVLGEVGLPTSSNTGLEEGASDDCQGRMQ
jgi:hypothetical protein